MMFEKAIQPAINHGWKEQVCGVTGMCGSLNADLYKDGKVLTVSILDEWQVTYPDEDEIRELFGEK
jgi:hypothetical protein